MTAAPPLTAIFLTARSPLNRRRWTGCLVKTPGTALPLLCAGDGPRLQVRHRPQVQLVVGHVDELRAVRGDGQALAVDTVNC